MLKFLETILTCLVGVLVLDVLWQVLTRYAMRHPSSWTDELATLLIVWVALLGASVGFVRRSHLGLDYFVSKFPAHLRRATEVFGHSAVGLFALTVLLVGGSKLVMVTLQTGQVSPALGIKMGYVYLALPVSGLVITTFSLMAIIDSLSELKPGSHH